MLLWPAARTSTTILTRVTTRPARLASQPTFLLELAPSLHRDLRAVELAFVFDTGFLRLFTSGLPSVSPREVVELPEGV